MNYWWNRNLSGIWAIFIWTYSPFLCTGILTAFFNFSFGFWIYSRRLSFFKHLVHLHYKCGLHQGLWACCHHSLKFNSQAHPVSLCPSRSAGEVAFGIQRSPRGVLAWDLGRWDRHHLGRIMWLIVSLSFLCFTPENTSVTISIHRTDWSKSGSSEIAGVIDKVAGLISKYQQTLRNLQMKNYSLCSTYLKYIWFNTLKKKEATSCDCRSFVSRIWKQIMTLRLAHLVRGWC